MMNTEIEHTSALSEADALRAAQQGDRQGFEALFHLHGRHVYRVVLRILRNVSDAEDLTQQVFLGLFRKIGTFRGESSLSTWLHRVATNAALMHLRRRRPAEQQTESLDGDFVLPKKHSDRSMLSAAERVSLARAIRQLPPGCRRHFVMHVVLGYEHHEIAELTGCTVSCSKSQVHKARKRLRAVLQPIGSLPAGEPAAA